MFNAGGRLPGGPPEKPGGMPSTPDPVPITPPFAVSSRLEGEDFWVLVSGELDLATNQDLRVALAAVELSPDGTVWLHLNELDFVDAASIDQLVRFVRLARDAGRDVGVAGAKGVVLRMIRLMGLEDELAVA